VRGDERLTRLEESLGFAERTVEQLSEELGRAFEEIDRLRARLARLEGRLEGVEERESMREAGEIADDPGVNKPPHAAG
jgi:uncharacterized coiled-coil protein SlyX